MRKIYLLLSVCLLLPESAFAISTITSPVINAGDKKVEARYSFETNETKPRDQRIQQDYLVEYGVTDWYAVRLTGTAWKVQDTDNKLRDVRIEQRFQLVEEKDANWSGGVRFVYLHNYLAHTPDNIDMELLASKKFRPFEGIGPINVTGNIAALHQVGAGATGGATLSTLWQAMAPVSEKWSAGMEGLDIYGNSKDVPGFSKQEHTAGPVFSYKLTPIFTAEFGYQFGLTKPASDGLTRLFLKAKW